MLDSTGGKSHVFHISIIIVSGMNINRVSYRTVYLFLSMFTEISQTNAILPDIQLNSIYIYTVFVLISTYALASAHCRSYFNRMTR